MFIIEQSEKMKKNIKTFLKVLLVLISIIIIFIGLFLLFLTITDYKPNQIERIESISNPELILKSNEKITLYTWNIGYGGLGADEDFFMDDGIKSKPESIEVVTNYMKGILETIASFDADFILIQEIDVKAKRSYYVDEKVLIDQKLSEYGKAFALNYDVIYVPVPFPPMGKVEAGLATYGKYHTREITRYALPGQYNWPVSVAMLDRCMLVSRIPIEGKTEEFVLANAHFSAYDDGSIRQQQLAYIKEFVETEYEKGNYVVLGGDWNQTFPSVNTKIFPVHKDGTFWMPFKIPENWISKDWMFGVGNQMPTYRLLNAPYEEGVTQVGVIDGFLVSPNIKLIESEVMDLSFENSDHNPVRIIVEIIE